MPQDLNNTESGSSHNPIKSIKIDFHSADGMTPKPAPVPKEMGANAKMPSGVNPPGTHIDPDPGLLAKSETTELGPLEEILYKHWLTANGIMDAEEPDSFYDYRGFYKATNGKMHPPGSVEHFPDTFKQHGHPTFSTESQYSKGPFDGGMWAGEKYLPQMSPVASHPSMGAVPQDSGSDPIRELFNLMQKR